MLAVGFDSCLVVLCRLALASRTHTSPSPTCQPRGFPGGQRPHGAFPGSQHGLRDSDARDPGSVIPELPAKVSVRKHLELQRGLVTSQPVQMKHLVLQDGRGPDPGPAGKEGGPP